MCSNILYYSKYNPSGNMTVLVHSIHHPDEFGRIAQVLMSKNHVCCEQVGFVMENVATGEYRLTMSGNEFCGNAAMSYVHYLATRYLLTESHVTVHVSGINAPVQCQIHKDGSYEVRMPQLVEPIVRLRVMLGEFEYEIFQLHFGAYVHYVVPIETEITDELRYNCEVYLKRKHQDHLLKTVGIMLFEPVTQMVVPLIYVPKIDSLIWERGCGSGTATIGNYLAMKRNATRLEADIHQPGGTIAVVVQMNNQGLYDTSIRGHVSTVSTGIAYIEE